VGLGSRIGLRALMAPCLMPSSIGMELGASNGRSELDFEGGMAGDGSGGWQVADILKHSCGAVAHFTLGSVLPLKKNRPK